MLLIGARGFLGSQMAETVAGYYNLFLGSSRPPESENDVTIEIRSADSVRIAFQKAKPDVVVMLAAISDIDRCERERDLAEAVNVLGAKNVAYEARQIGARMLFTSSAAVYDGVKFSYLESDPVCPVSWYGETKARGENEVLALLPSAVVIRFALAVGLSKRSGTNSMTDNLIESLKSGKQTTAPAIEIRNILDPETLCKKMMTLVTTPAAEGIFHLGASDTISRYDLCVKIAEGLGFESRLISPQNEPVPGRAPRGKNHFLISEKLSRFSSNPLPTCENVIERCIHAASQSSLRTGI